MKTLKLLLEEYKELTLKLISEVKDAEQLQKILEERGKLLVDIERTNIDKKAFTNMAKELNLLELEQQLKSVLEGEKAKVKKELDNLRRQRQANKSYGKMNVNINFFDRRT